MHWYRFIDADTAEWIWIHALARGLTDLANEMERIADTVSPW